MDQIVQTEESIKLYEYASFKPELDEDTLEHFGILGMHWGQRNGPPYPLSSKISTGKRLKGGSGSGSISRKRKKALKKARKTRAKNIKLKTLEKQKQQQIEKTKEEIIKSKDIKAMLNNADKFTSQEINDMLNRLDVEKRLRDKVVEADRANRSSAQKFKDMVKESTKKGLTSATKSLVSTVSENALKIGTKKLVEKAFVDGNPEYKQLVDQLFREKKK